MHYNTAHAKRTFEADDYRRIVEAVPTLIGTKLPKGDPLWFATVCRRVPDLSHFSGEYTFVADMAGGASGMYSWLAAVNPSLAVRWYDHCVAGDWNRAMAIQQRVLQYKIDVKSHWAGTSDAAVNKADLALNANIRCPLRVAPPYRSCTEADVERARTWARAHFPELPEAGS